ncbi:Carnitine O-palmitoyltransferase 1 muscle isoform [Taenia crassiceps]|uniref:Carnitine O-palmitoyltransferase 1 muscle isoform n=1 Tax=Taenia crassiceps TaxID=6207 RepID=A0ABR4QJZ9_9CEST
MDVNVEDVRILQLPRSNPIGLIPLLNWFASSIWPVRLYQVILCLSLGFSVDRYSDVFYLKSVRERIIHLNEWCLPFISESENFRCFVSIELSIFFLLMLVWIRRTFLRWTLSYTRWIYYPEPSSDDTFWGRLWYFCLWLGSGSAPHTFQMDRVLPSLPLPDVAITIKRLMGSLSPYLGKHSTRYQEIEAGLQKWYKEESSGCQRRLKVKKWLSGNYATLWWESYTFLCHRQPTNMDTTFVAFQDSKHLLTKNPLARAAVLIYLYGNIRSLLKAGCINPEMFKHQAPMCMAQWYRLFSTTRIPSEHQDDLWTYPPSLSKHVVVVHNNHFYKVPLFTKWRKIVSPDLLQRMLRFVVEDSREKSEFEVETFFSPAVLTTLSRDEWQKIRSDYFTYGINNASLIEVEKAICLVCLETDSSMQHYQAKGKLWVDKSINFCVLPNADVSFHVDWSSMDPSFFAGVLERLRVAETEAMYDPATGDAVRLEEADHECDDPLPLNWHCFDEMVPIYNRALQLCQKDRKSYKFASLNFTAFGRSRVKFDWCLCTDAFIQAALHATHFRLTGRLALCAEYVPCRLFINGRSETLRSLTTEMEDFVRCFGGLHRDRDKPAKASKASECLELLKKACERHEFLLKHALTGKGIDRCLLALNIAHKFRTLKPCEVLDKILKMPFNLFTCRLPDSASEGAWRILLPTLDQSGAIHVTYASRTDPEAFHFSITGVENRVENFAHVLNQVLLDMQNLPFPKAD